MAQIIHLIAGGPDWIPTKEELADLVQRFQASQVIMHGIRVKVETFEAGHFCESKLIITAGSADWDPTQKELDDIQAQFQAALYVDHTSVIATRSNVKVRVLNDYVSEASAMARATELKTATTQFTEAIGG